MNKGLGIDVGATGIKGAIINLETGELLTERVKIETPKPATPEAILTTVKELIAIFNWENKPFGVGFPAIIKNGAVLSASNIDESWLEYPIVKKWTKALGATVSVINDADAAGLAEVALGKAKGVDGFLVFLTLGTGIGSGIFLDGKLIPNSEFGRMYYKDSVAEKYASNSAREREDMSWKQYGKALNEYLNYLEFIFNPKMFILGGGISKKFEKFSKQFTLKTPVTNALLLNNAGLIGAAMASKQDLKF